jgi:hypothetical protein
MCRARSMGFNDRSQRRNSHIRPSRGHEFSRTHLPTLCGAAGVGGTRPSIGTFRKRVTSLATDGHDVKSLPGGNPEDCNRR